MRTTIAALLVAFLASTPAKAGLYELFHPKPSAAELDKMDDATCRGYGVARGSNAYVACRMNLANNRTSQEMVDSVNRERRSRSLMWLGIAATRRPW